jgi:hypothetical protein
MCFNPSLSCLDKAPCLDEINTKPHHEQLKAEGFAIIIQNY